MTAVDTPIRAPDQIRQDCARKLRAVQGSEHFQAILGCLLGEDWATPRLLEMVIAPTALFSVGVVASRGFRPSWVPPMTC